jgi:uncharacterized protein YllA (UPF0747 family)
VNSGLIDLPAGLAPGLAPRWSELYASGAEFGTAAPRVRELEKVRLRSGPLFGEADFIRSLRDRHLRLGADERTMASIEALGSGAACVITGQQPHLLTGPFYTAWKLLGAIALAQRLEELHEHPVVPVYWCGSDDSDFDEVRSAWLFDPNDGPWRLEVPGSHWDAGRMVGDLEAGAVAELERHALGRLSGAGVEWLRQRAAEIDAEDFGTRSAAWVLRLFRESGLVVIDARDPGLRRVMRPWLERYAAVHEEAADALDARAEERAAQDWGVAIDPSARRSGIFVHDHGRRVKLEPGEFDDRSAREREWSPSVLLRPVVQDALLAPVAAVLGPGELAYHAELAPIYPLLDVQAARPAPRPHLVLTGSKWPWPGTSEGVERLLAGGNGAVEELTEAGLDPAQRLAFEDFRRHLEAALADLESRLKTRVDTRSRARLLREIERLQGIEGAKGEAAAANRRRAEWLARGRHPQERAYSCWLLWAWCANPVRSVLGPLAERWLETVDEGKAVHWVLPMKEIP